MEKYINFDPDLHEYSIKGNPIPSVTQILKKAGYIDDRFFTKDSRDRGTAVHELCRRYANGQRTDKIGRILEQLEYVNAFSNWMKKNHVYVIKSESKIYGNIENKEYAGRFDILAYFHNKKILVDIKTGGKIKWHNLQLAAYAMASFENDEKINPDKLMDLYIKKNGKFIESYINPIELPNYMNQFKEALSNC